MNGVPCAGDAVGDWMAVVWVSVWVCSLKQIVKLLFSPVLLHCTFYDSNVL